MSKSDGLERSPTHLLHRANQSVSDLFSNEIKSDLTPRQLAVLTVISQNEGCSQTDIVDRTGIDRSTIADIVRRMQRKDLLERRRTKEDARVYAVKLTDKGRKVLKNADPLAKRVDEKILRALGSRSAAFLDNLATLVERLDAAQSSQP
jgi:MarR family transcriptional regulator, temperature-dependent positive regulator of motility